jgi:hypothetical protein
MKSEPKTESFDLKSKTTKIISARRRLSVACLPFSCRALSLKKFQNEVQIFRTKVIKKLKSKLLIDNIKQIQLVILIFILFMKLMPNEQN